MAHRYYRSDADERTRRFRESVNDMPWATPSLHQGYAGLTKKQMLTLRQSDLRDHVMDSAAYPNGGKRPSPIRCALRPGVSGELRPYGLSRSELKMAFLSIARLDVARFLFAEWMAQAQRVDWALSPYTVPRSDTQIEFNAKSGTFNPKLFQKSRSLKFDLIGSMLLDRRRINFVVLVDPGGIDVRWFYNVFRVFHRWQRRPEFAIKPRQIQNDFPVLVMVAANMNRAQQCLYLWRHAPGFQQRPCPLAITTYQFLSKSGEQRPWWNERGERHPLWNNTWGATQVPPKPDRLPGKHPSHMPAFVRRSTPIRSLPETRSMVILPRRSVAVQHQESLTWNERELLKLIGRYPLLTPQDMTRLMRWRLPNVYRCLVHLAQLCQEQDGGFFLSPDGIDLLARQADFAPVEYAKLCQWQACSVSTTPKSKVKQLRLNMDAVSFRARHDRMILDFLSGLANCELLTLLHFDKESPYVMPKQHQLFAIPGKTDAPHVIVVPDASGVVQVRRTNITERTDFWLEVDRGTIHREQLKHRLEKHYEASMGYMQLIGRMPRLLFVVDEVAGDERVSEILRLLKELDGTYHRKLDAFVVRRDRLWESRAVAVPGKARQATINHRHIQQRPTRVGETCNPARRIWQHAHQRGLHFAFKGLS